MIELHKLEGENEEQFIWRLCSAKDSGILNLDWKSIGDIINKECREDETEYRNESAYRKQYQYTKKFFEAGVFSNTKADEEYSAKLQDTMREFRMERQKLFDERTVRRKDEREASRRETVYEITKRAIDDHVKAKFEFIPSDVPESDCDFVIHLTDVHAGMTIDSKFNKYDTEILRLRLLKYLDEIYELGMLYHPENAYLILGGDMIHGLIHLNSRIESKENIIQQIMVVSDLVGNFINELRKMFAFVEVHTTAGNHSRALADKEAAVKGENFDLLIPYICKKEFQNVPNVYIVTDNILDSDIATFEVRGHMAYASHGNKDTVKNVVYNMTKFARKAGLRLPDLCFLGHRHTNGLTTVDDVKVIQSGCVDGMDNYCIDGRMVGTPEQSVTVVSAEKKVKAFCDIQIDV